MQLAHARAALESTCSAVFFSLARRLVPFALHFSTARKDTLHLSSVCHATADPPPPPPHRQTGHKLNPISKQFVIAFNCHTAALASGGLSLLVPFFGGDDDIAALLLAFAILERDTSAELVVLSFLEPNNPSTGAGGGAGPAASGRGNGNGNGIGAGSEVSRPFLAVGCVP